MGYLLKKNKSFFQNDSYIHHDYWNALYCTQCVYLLQHDQRNAWYQHFCGHEFNSKFKTTDYKFFGSLPLFSNISGKF